MIRKGETREIPGRELNIDMAVIMSGSEAKRQRGASACS